MSQLLSLLRIVVGCALGLMLIELFHTMASAWTPAVYAPLQSDPMRLAMLGLITLAGIIACFVVATVARGRTWPDLAVFIALMLAVDASAILGDLATQPFWFKAAVLAVIPLQAWLGAQLSAASRGRLGEW